MKKKKKDAQKKSIIRKSVEDLFSGEPPWPLWDDAEINQTVWDQSEYDFSLKTGSASKGDSTFDEAELSQMHFIDDLCRMMFPLELDVDCWKRPVELRPDADDYFRLDFEPGDLDLYVNNEHLFQFEVMRHIISSISCLEKASRMYPYFATEFLTSTNYVPNNTDSVWKPWQNVYSFTEAGLNTEHKPSYNKYGLYYVRLFHMGGWRRIKVDDYIPLNSNNEWLLPRSKMPYNLWMPLLTKALIKLSAVMLSPGQPFTDFNVITAFTGYFCTSTTFNSTADANLLWRILEYHLKHPLKTFPDSYERIIKEMTDISEGTVVVEEEEDEQLTMDLQYFDDIDIENIKELKESLKRPRPRNDARMESQTIEQPKVVVPSGSVNEEINYNYEDYKKNIKQLCNEQFRHDQKEITPFQQIADHHINDIIPNLDIPNDPIACIDHNKKALSSDPGSTIVLLYLKDNNLVFDHKDLPLTYEGATFVFGLQEKKVAYDIPNWKMLRWTQVAYDYEVIPVMPGDIKRNIKLYIPLKRRINTNKKTYLAILA